MNPAAWLALLLEAYAIVDAGVTVAIHRVFDKVCTVGEGAYYARRQDVLTPIRSYANEAFDVLLPFYGIKNSGERKRMIQSGEAHRLVKVLQEYDWPKLAERLQAFDTRHAAET